MKKLTKEEKAAKARGDAFRAEEKAKLLNGNLVDHLKEIQRMEDVARRYYYWASPLWKAIREHISRAQDCVLINRKGTIVSHRGTGSSVSCHNVVFVGYESIKNERLEFDITVEYFGEGEENSYQPNTYRSTHHLSVPPDLEENFTPAKFNQWVAEKKKKRDAEVEKAELKELARLKKKYGIKRDN